MNCALESQVMYANAYQLVYYRKGTRAVGAFVLIIEQQAAEHAQLLLGYARRSSVTEQATREEKHDQIDPVMGLPFEISCHRVSCVLETDT